jgi:dihydroorotate dehydrogenase (NAD+) catalytic subunit
MADLSVKLFGKTLRNPVMNASGTLGYGEEIEAVWPVDRMGAYVSKGLSLLPHHGNPPPRLWEEKSGIINSIGLQNVGVTRFFDEHFPLFRARQTPVIINFFGFTEEEYVGCAAAIKADPLIVALEINLSCPNIKQGGLCLGKEADGVFRIIRKVREVTELPLVAKLTPEVTDIVGIAQAAHKAGANGITVLNTFPAASIDMNKRAFALRGGLSGPFLKPLALKAVAAIANAVPIPVIGTGGIMNHEDALQFLMAGATAVQVGTATFVDPFAIPKIIEGMGTYMEDHGTSSIEEIIGSASV